jgi:uncharacterized membrane protein
MASPPAIDAAAAHSPRSVRLVALGLTAILALGLVPRLYSLSERSLWFDEAFCWRLIQFPFLEMIERVGRDNHPPLYFMLLKGWATLFGDSAWTLRFLSVLFGLATIAGTYLFGSAAYQLGIGAHRREVASAKLVSNRPFRNAPSRDSISRAQAFGLFSASLVGLGGLQIRYSWEMRMYALTAALAVFSSWALVRALLLPESLTRWLLYGCLSLLLAYSHYYGLFTLASQAVFAALYLWRGADWQLTALLRQRQFWNAVATAVVVVMAWLPWLPVFLRQHAQVKAAFWSGPVDTWDVGELCYQTFLRPEYLPRPSQQVLLWALVSCCIGVYLLVRKAAPGDWLIVCLGLGPLASSLFASIWDVPAFTLRYFVPAHVFLVVGLAALVWRLRARVERGIAALFVVVFFVAVDVEFYQTMDLHNRPGSRGAAAFLSQDGRASEPVVSTPFFFFSLLHHASDRRACYVYADAPLAHYYGTAAMTNGDVIDAARLKSPSSSRVWVVDLGGGFLGYQAVPVPAFWVQRRQQVFPDLFNLGNLILTEYSTRHD